MSEKQNILGTAGRPSTRAGKAQTLASLADHPATKRVNFDLDAAQHQKLKIHAARQGKTVKELLTEFVANLPNE
ncbi:macrodomain Ter protein organizer (MatP/YcbG family) [Paraburkholderia tropica]|uniref:chromosome partitioning protein ParB n=1 Tax=Paraburkholderia TaxID=1822464 RepID=UPI00160753E2|nr:MULTISPECIES: chromosome partitioning protein ParB [Paraburkholderia]MBB3005326.1 macrodomain Ter protein organizer (MatP/YcbG family) [Paraburkholderia tropica]MBN3813660.1 chromosome partitioning protein ParB [Paraburkholderia sp. Ac-20347]